MLGGIVGKILRVDLTAEKVEVQDYSEEYLRKYVGGDGLAARIIYDEVAPGTDALDQESRLVVSAGPLAGTHVEAGCNYSIAAKSPITGFTIYNAHSNGFFAPRLKFSGYDAVVIKGKASRPVYLWLHEGDVEIRDASGVWGKDTRESEDGIKREVKEERLSCISIGPAGENQVMMACVVNDRDHHAARGGIGAVMGSKNLKAIAAFGTRKVPIADEEGFRVASEKWRKVNKSNVSRNLISRYGTGAFLETFYKVGDVPIKNWSSGVIEGWEKLTGQYSVEHMFKRNLGCWGCSIVHNKLLLINEGPFSGEELRLPEYEVASAWGANIGVTDPGVAAKGGDICCRYGLDSLGTSNAVGFAMECYEKGLLTKDDTGGLDLRFGNYEAAFKMIDQIVRREGLGGILAYGPARAAEYIGKGSENFVAHVKGMPIPMHDFRGLWGYALQYAIGSAGPAHEGGPVFPEASGAISRQTTVKKAATVKSGQEWRCFVNTLGVCSFGMMGIDAQTACEALSAVTGVTFTPEESRKIALRLVNLRRGFNIRNGLKPEDDTLSPRLLEAPSDGGSKGSQINLRPMVNEYYDLMGWDKKTGKPYRRTLVDLGLEDVAEDLWG